jgi:methanogenic corrinoid protein MtbC1
VVTTFHFSTDATRASETVDALAYDAVRWVGQTLAERYERHDTVPGAAGRLMTSCDLSEYVEFLAAALATPAPQYFKDYERWLSAVLESRGLPVQILDEPLLLLREFFEDRLDPATLRPVLEMLDAGSNARRERDARPDPLYHAHLPEALPEVEALTRAMLRGDMAAAREIGRAVAVHGYVRAATHLFQPALYAIGLMWQRNEITVAQEHLATAIAQNIMAQLFAAADFAPPLDRKALFAAVPENQHALGPRMVSDAFELAGWSVHYLGANTPIEALVAQVDTWRPEVVGISASLVQQLSGLKETVDALRAAFGTQCPHILVGGIPVNQIDGIWRWTGADAWSQDAEKAVSIFT